MNTLKVEDDTVEYYSRASTTISIYTTTMRNIYEAKIQKRQKYTFANKLNNYSREADIKQKEAFNAFYSDLYFI